MPEPLPHPANPELVVGEPPPHVGVKLLIPASVVIATFNLACRLVVYFWPPADWGMWLMVWAGMNCLIVLVIIAMSRLEAQESRTRHDMKGNSGAVMNTIDELLKYIDPKVAKSTDRSAAGGKPDDAP